MNTQGFAAVLLRVSGILFIIATIPLGVDLILSNAEAERVEQYYSDLYESVEVEETTEDESANSEDYVADVAFATNRFPDMKLQVFIHIGIGICLILFCNPLSRLVVAGIPGDKRKTGP